MDNKFIFIVLSLVLLAKNIRAQDDDDEMDDDFPSDVPPGTNKMVFKPPEINEEEQHSNRLPSNMACDGCKAAAYQIGTKLQSAYAMKYKKSKRPAPESDIIDLIEDACKSKSFDGYGLKSVNGVNRLSGPGSDAEKEPGMMQGGGRWPGRLAMNCGELVGELEEMEIYNYVVKYGGDKLYKLMCQNPEEKRLNSCGRKKDEL